MLGVWWGIEGHAFRYNFAVTEHQWFALSAKDIQLKSRKLEEERIMRAGGSEDHALYGGIGTLAVTIRVCPISGPEEFSVRYRVAAPGWKISRESK